MRAASEQLLKTQPIPKNLAEVFSKKDLAEVFSKRKCNILTPPLHPTDCIIKNLSGAKLPKPKMYSMMPRDGGVKVRTLTRT